jgi:hypothetical protein
MFKSHGDGKACVVQSRESYRGASVSCGGMKCRNCSAKQNTHTARRAVPLHPSDWPLGPMTSD